MTYDSTQLDAELRAAGLRIHGCASTGRIDWIDPPTPAEQTVADAVLRAHDSTKRERDDQTERTGIRSVISDLLAATTDQATWNALTAAQRSEATRRGLRALALFIRREVRA